MVKITFEKFFSLFSDEKYLVKYQSKYQYSNPSDSRECVFKKSAVYKTIEDKNVLFADSDLRFREEDNKEIVYDEKMNCFTLYHRVFDEEVVEVFESVDFDGNYAVYPLKKRLDTYELIPYYFTFYKRVAGDELLS